MHEKRVGKGHLKQKFEAIKVCLNESHVCCVVTMQRMLITQKGEKKCVVCMCVTLICYLIKRIVMLMDRFLVYFGDGQIQL